MRHTTICFPIRGSRILLGMKKHRPGGENFGTGKWNGFGGKRKKHETILTTAARELAEESHLVASAEDLEDVARIRFFEGEAPLFDCSVFLARRWHGVERETGEMQPKWFDVTEIPYDAMWAGDRQWIPLVLAGKKLSGILRFKPGMQEVASFVYVERKI